MAVFTLLQTDWAHDALRLSAIRRTVFIDEQGVPEDMEWDDEDAGAVHFLALDEKSQPIGCARLLPQGSIGRMAVLPLWRGHGVGQALLEATIGAAKAGGHAAITLSAQTHAETFYLRAGFVKVGDEYEEAGIPHIGMVKKLV